MRSLPELDIGIPVEDRDLRMAVAVQMAFLLAILVSASASETAAQTQRAEFPPTGDVWIAPSQIYRPKDPCPGTFAAEARFPPIGDVWIAPCKPREVEIAR